MKPSEVALGIPPLVDTFREAECEAAAAIMVRAMARNGDAFAPVTLKQLGTAIQLDLDEKVEPMYSLRENPSWRPAPGFRGLVKRGFAAFVTLEGARVFDYACETPDMLIEFTEEGLKHLERWKR